MGSTWGMWMRDDPIFDTATRLAGDDPHVWLRGVAELDRLAVQELRRQMDGRGRDPSEDRLALGNVRRTLRPYRDRLLVLLPRPEMVDPPALARLCRLAGYSRDPRFKAPLRRIFQGSQAEEIQDAAAIGLGLLGDASGIDRLRALATRPETTDDSSKNAEKREALWALDAIEEASAQSESRD
jgi:hypothetical protein